MCCMSREKVSISLDKDEKSLRTFKLQHMVKAVPPTLWRLTSFFSLVLNNVHYINNNHVNAQYITLVESLNYSRIKFSHKHVCTCIVHKHSYNYAWSLPCSQCQSCDHWCHWSDLCPLHHQF